MAAWRLSMRKIREILRLRVGEKRTQKEVGLSVGVSQSTVHDYVVRAKLAGLSWPLPSDVDDGELERLMFPTEGAGVPHRAGLDLTYIHREMRRKHVTLMLLWQEYKQNHPNDGYQYTQFCEQYRRFKKRLDVTMRQEHKAGDKCFVDWSGDGIDIINRETGEVTTAPLFVAVLGASSYTFAKAALTETSRDWLSCHMAAYEFFGGVPAATIPDNTKTAVTKPNLYEPDLNPTYYDMARHYQTAVIPARTYRPKDKAKVESGVLLAQRWILASLRNHQFFSMAEANNAIAEKLDILNGRKFQKLDTTRKELFEQLDKPALRALPAKRYEFAEWSSPRVNIDYHVRVDHHHYSVPYQLSHEKVEVRRTGTLVEIFYKGRRVASHPRSYCKGGYTTLSEHMPDKHRKYLEWTPERITGWASKIGPQTNALAERIMGTKAHPQQGFQACLGIFRLASKYGDDRLEAACGRALMLGATTFKCVNSILKSGLDKQQLLPNAEQDDTSMGLHENVRGPDYYQ